MKKKTLFLIVSMMIMILVSCERMEDQFQVQDESLSLKSANTQMNYNTVPNELLVKFKEGVDENRKAAVLAKFGGKLKERIVTKMMERHGFKQGIAVVNVPGSVSDAIAMVKGLSDVEYAEPNYIYTHQASSNDPYYINGSLWGMYGDGTSPANQYGSQAGEAWAMGHTGSNTVYIGIIDEGYMYTHFDLAANAGKNPGEIAGDRIDNDGNGYVDDVYGWDFNGKDNTVFDGITDDHGTHVAGTIGAVGGNATGVAGVCWNVKLISAKFLGTRGGTTDNAIKAVDYLTNLKKTQGLNIVASNNSWGGGGFSQFLKDAIDRAAAENILFIAAAGNNGTNNDATPSYPASYTSDNIIAVAAITSSGALASFSQYGATSVDIGAPGNGIFSCIPVKSGKSIVSGYASYSGTSMATPHVSGAVALYASTHPGATAAQIKKAILDAAVPTSSLTGKCVTNGRLNVSEF